MSDRNLNPHAEARVAMALWSDRYSKQTLGCKDFYDGLTAAQKATCAQIVDGIIYADRADGRTPAPSYSVGSDDDETYEIGKRDGYSEAVQQIDQLTGGDGEYRYCTDHDPDRHTPGPAEMIQRIADRFETLNLLRDAEKTGRDQEWGDGRPDAAEAERLRAIALDMQKGYVALRDLVDRAQAIISTSTYPNWHETARAALSSPMEGGE